MKSIVVTKLPLPRITTPNLADKNISFISVSVALFWQFYPVFGMIYNRSAMENIDKMVILFPKGSPPIDRSLHPVFIGDYRVRQ